MSGGAILDRSAAREWTGRRVLLTGASGFLGQQVARQAFAAGVALHTLGRRLGPTEAVHHHADLTDPSAVAEAVRQARPEAVIHCAAPGVAPGSQSFAAMLEVAETGTEALYAACVELPEPPRVVHVGSGFEHAAAAESYGAAKAAATAVALRFAQHLPLALLRPFHLYGAGEAAGRMGPFLIRQARAGKPIPLSGCEQVRDFLHVDDCAAFLWQGLGLTGTYEIGSGTNRPLRGYVEALTAELAARGIVAECQFEALPYRPGEPMVSLPDLTAWNAAGGRTAQVTLTQGAADLVDAELTQCR